MAKVLVTMGVGGAHGGDVPGNARAGSVVGSVTVNL
jgi:hypothetical protein